VWGSKVSGRGRAAAAFMSFVAVAALVAACGAPAPAPSGPLGIVGFAASRTAGPAPLTTTFTWTLAGVESGLTCSLDVDGDDTFELTIPNCTSSSARSVTVETPGTVSSRLRVTDGTATVTSAPVTLTVGAPADEDFEITFRFHPSVTESQQDVFEMAAARWAQVVRTGLPDVTFSAPADECGTGAPAFSGTVDDVLVDVSVVPIDGVGGVLGVAGPCLVRTVGELPAFAAMQFDSADVAAMVADGRFTTVVLHEMGHVLGIGTLWDLHATGLGTSNPLFHGLTARGAWSGVTGGAASPVPIEATGGPGTADAHWRESVLGDELMTGWISLGLNPLSEVTIGALADLGYGVDLGAADGFGWAAARDPDTPRTRVDTVLIRPTGTVG
jgi:hypothetical protein